MITHAPAWHFVGDTLRNGDLIPPDGETLCWDGDLKICQSGLHASRRLIDALKYAPGATICRVECSGEYLEDTDKLVCRGRTIRWRIDGTQLLRDFARQCALDVIDLWDAPDVVRDYLETSDESLRDAARAAVWDAAWAAARDAARDAAGDAAWVAAGDAARVAALAAAWATHGNAAWDAARDAAWAAAGAAARAAVWDTAWAAARDAQNERLTQMVMEAHDEGSPRDE